MKKPEQKDLLSQFIVLIKLYFKLRNGWKDSLLMREQSEYATCHV